MYGSSATSSICGLTTATLLESGVTPAYVTVSTSSGNPILSFSNIWNQCLIISLNQVIHQFKKPKYFEEFNLVGFTHSICIKAIKLKNWNHMNLRTNNQTPTTILKLKPSLKTSIANNKILLNQNICDWLISKITW